MLDSACLDKKQSGQPVDLTQSISLLEKYLAQLSVEGFVGSTSKRVGVTLVINGLDAVLGAKPLYLPLKWVTTALTGGLAKYAGQWMVKQPPTSLGAISNEVPFLSELADFVHIEAPTAKQKQPTTLWRKTKAIVVTFSDEAKAYVTDVTPQDIVSGTFATLGSAAATTTLVFISGPPGWLALPAWWLAEGSTKSFAAFIGNWWSQQLWGAQAKIPICQHFGAVAQEATAPQSLLEASILSASCFIELKPALISSQMLNDDLMATLVEDFQLLTVREEGSLVVSNSYLPLKNSMNRHEQGREWRINFCPPSWNIIDDYVPLNESKPLKFKSGP